MNLEELLKSNRPPKKDEITDEDLAILFMKYKGLLKQTERNKSFWAATHENIRIAYAKLDEVVEARTAKLRHEMTDRKKAEEELASSREFLNSVIERSPVSLWISNNEGTLIKMNQSCRELFGATDEEVVGKYNILKDNLIEEQGFIPLVENVFEKGEIARFTINYDLPRVEHVKISGAAHKILDVVISPIKDMHGKVTNAIVQHKDITERKRAEEALEKKQYYLEKAQEIGSVGTWELDILKNKLIWTDQNYRNFGVPIGSPLTYEIFLNCIHPDDRDYVNTEWMAAIKGKPYDIEHRIMVDGKVKWVREKADVTFDKEGKATRAIGFTQEITELKQAEQELRKYREHLEELVTQRTAQLEVANKELEAFSYSVSHDLRAPLRAICGFSNVFLEDYHNKLDDEEKRLLNIIRENAKNMGDLIDDLLVFSRLGRSFMKSSKTDMIQLAREVIKQHESFAPERKMEIIIGDLPPAFGDRAMIRQVFTNLISNAFKFTRTRDPAVIEIGSLVEGNFNIYFVRDNGVGFEMKYKGKLFGVFQRLHSSKEFEGTGVGLAIVKRIVDRHGGRVWAESEINNGSTFYFTMPAIEKEEL